MSTTVIRPPASGRAHRPGENQAYVPRRCTLEGFAEEVSRVDGLSINELESISTLLIRTQNSLYRVIVLQPPDANIIVQGGHFFPEASEGRLIGSSFGGSFLKMGWIGIGFRMEIYQGLRRIVTSPVQSIEILRDPGPF